MVNKTIPFSQRKVDWIFVGFFLVNLFFITYIAANLSLVAYGVLALSNPGILLDSFRLRVYQFPPDATAAVDYLSALFRLLGYFNFVLGIVGLILLRRYGINRQRCILQPVIASSLLAYLGPIVFDNTVGDIGVIEIIENILFLAMILSGIFMLNEQNHFDSYDALQAGK